MSRKFELFLYCPCPFCPKLISYDTDTLKGSPISPNLVRSIFSLLVRIRTIATRIRSYIYVDEELFSPKRKARLRFYTLIHFYTRVFAVPVSIGAVDASGRPVTWIMDSRKSFLLAIVDQSFHLEIPI